MTKMVVPSQPVKYPALLIGFIISAVLAFGFDLKPGSPVVTYTAAIAVLMAIWWVTEAIPIAVTSLVPVVFFPLFGIMDGKAVSNSYINYIIFLFIGGFIMALAMEKWELDKRIALKILSLVGGNPFTILFGFLFASAFLSMWMSNTATAMMMLPIALSVTGQIEEIHGAKNAGRLNAGILLGIAYGCSIGGIATLVGTPPNLSFVRIFNILFPQGPEVSFGEWLIFALPLSAAMFISCLFLLFFMFRVKGTTQKFRRDFFRKEYQKLGDMTAEQKRVLFVFLLLVFLWVFRESIEFGSIRIPGWSRILHTPNMVNDGTVAIFIALLLFIIPSSQKRSALMDWPTARKMPWRIVLLFGGGFALAQGFVDSGLSLYIGEQLKATGHFSLAGLVSILTTAMCGLTEFTSNTATTEMLLPIVGALSVQINVNPLLLMLPVTLAGSMAFMFPIATPPNAIVYGSGKVSMWQMAKAGIWLNLAAIFLITLFTLFWGSIVLGIDLTAFPEWAVIPVE
ncbi:MAG: SLC13 family permease [Prolixibacteraceae bacterium]|jgi:sodium-dependent dicarboxylate transporter 2/3/5|nr:SLC13 family permease [Prolixibacteraceae bacterium]